MRPNQIITPKPRRLAACAAAAGLLAGMLAGVLALAPSASASSPTAHDPIGTVKASAVRGGVMLRGWAADPDALRKNVTVVGLVDGRTVTASHATSLRNAAVTKAHKTGSTPGFALSVPVKSGKHTVCLVVRNIGAGLDAVRKCVTTPLGKPLTSGQLAAHKPVGALTNAWANKKSVHYVGWTSDPDDVGRASLVVLYVDGRPAVTTRTVGNPAPRPAKAGYLSKIDILVSTSVATHVGCLWVVNAGLGSNTFLGCRAVDNRKPAPQSLARTAAPALNAKVVAEAKKHIGQPYVWGATGPKKFDCSGLVMYSYGKQKLITPRVSQDQIKAARLIPASHAQPGDLVFLHDSVGDVYHVAIYLSPGLTVAAIDEAEGVNYQRIWDPTVTYGSFTHT